MTSVPLPDHDSPRNQLAEAWVGDTISRGSIGSITTQEGMELADADTGRTEETAEMSSDMQEFTSFMETLMDSLTQSSRSPYETVAMAAEAFLAKHHSEIPKQVANKLADQRIALIRRSVRQEGV